MHARGRLFLLPWLATTLLALFGAGAGIGCSSKPAPTTTTVALVYCGWEIWIGNDQNPKLAADDPSRSPGALLAIQAALDRADLAHTAPPGTQAVAISYADTVAVRVPLGPIANLTSAALGKQTDYAGTIGVELVAGLSRAADELDRAPAGRKLLIIVSDGADTNADQAAKQLPELKKRLAARGVEVASILYKTALSGERDVLSALTDHSVRAWSRDDITFELVNLLQRLQPPRNG
jgi:hypothetical protein